MSGIYQGDLMESLGELLKNNREKIGRVVSLDLRREKVFVFDFTSKNKELKRINIESANEFDRFVKNTLRKNNAAAGIGRYAEDRIIYKWSELYGTERTIHLGIDLILPASTGILSPLDAIVHSFQNNRACGDYGPTIILQHELEGIAFYTLYGHLSEESLDKEEGQEIKKGEVIGSIGDTKINGGWFEALHFQIIADMLGMKGDFPGVASAEKRMTYLEICPDPNLILQIDNLYPGQQ